jgi:hypothetical protein
MTCKIKVTKEVTDIFPQYRPQVGQVYEAELSTAVKHLYAEFCIIHVHDKKIALRKGEYEIV